jgi:flagellar basal-body rod protein FlgG
MIRSLWIGKTGLEAQQNQIDVIANNIANVNTSGFKRSRAVFEDLLYQTVRQSGTNSTQQTQVPEGFQVGTGVKPVGTTRIHLQGNLQQTGNPLDVAVQGRGFFQITLPDGTVGYTRDGSFHVDSQGQLVTSSGFQVSPGITIPANATGITIGQDGTISITQPGGGTPAQAGSIQLATFQNPAGLQGIGQNLFVETAASGTATIGDPGTDGLGLLNQGYVETSNVNVAEELVNMIQAQRAYELNSKVLQTTDQMLQRLAQI